MIKDLDSAAEEKEIEFDYKKILNTFRKSWKVISFFSICGLGVAILLLSILSNRWEATATIQIGRVIGFNGESRLVEDQLQTVERIKLKQFIENVLISLKLPIEDNVNARTDLFKKSLKALPIKGSEFVSISLQDFEPVKAEQALNAVVTELKAEQIEVTLPYKTKIKTELKMVQERLSHEKEQYTALEKQINNSGVISGKANFSPSVVVTNLMMAKQAEVRSLMTTELTLKSQLDTFDSQSSHVISRVSASERPVFPKKSIFLGLGLLIGFSLGFLIAFFKNNYKEK